MFYCLNGLLFSVPYVWMTKWSSASIQRITVPEILEDEWFKKDYKPPAFDEKEDANLDDVEAVFKDSEVFLPSTWIMVRALCHSIYIHEINVIYFLKCRNIM